MRRSRRIAQYGAGSGQFCMGALKETWPCNPSPAEATPTGCSVLPPVDCALGSWSPWSSCTATCAGGEHTRSRTISQEPANGGKACDGALAEVEQCNNMQCPGPAPVDCQYGEWQDWAACDKCSGERSRSRQITTYAENGGKACGGDVPGQEWFPFQTQEVSSCPRQCGEKKYCTWGDWAAWGDCTAQCGQGKRVRRRYLGVTTVPSAPPPPMQELMRKFSEQSVGLDKIEENRTQEMLAAFTCGFLSFIVMLSGIRVFSTMRTRSAVANQRQGLAEESQELRSEFTPSYHHIQELNATDVPLVWSA